MNSQSSFSSIGSSAADASGALHILLSPDGYYTYLGITKPPSNTSSSTLEKSSPEDKKIYKTLIQKNYRKLSLRLHPDRPSGNEEAFRVLERAKHVLTSDKLRKQYDLLGLDLEDDDHSDESHQEDEDGNTAGEKKSANENPDGVLGHMASATVAAFLQMAVRTGMMAIASVYITQWKYTTIPVILFLLYTALQIHRAGKSIQSAGSPSPVAKFDILSPILLSVGVFIMYFAKSTTYSETPGEWSKLFWTGEVLVMTMFCLNTVASKEISSFRPTLVLGIACYIFFGLIGLYIRGKGWRYLTFLAIELGCALVAVLVFPIMEMIMETLVDEKMKKVGERVRLYSKVMEENYQNQLEQMEKKLSKGGAVSGVGGSADGARMKHDELD
mmetsp:Transcript_20736/g.30633  ORF Transcript_20736/g.30633 Transcript_20736/m.30633 type:complete len:386 (-) Transcript_20736:55-1212(-)